jgi:hypothetical protein
LPRRHALLAYAAVLTNAALYLTVLFRSASDFMIRHDPSWEFFDCEPCRLTTYSILTWGVLLAGLIALFLRRRAALVLIMAVNVYSLVFAWSPIFFVARVLRARGVSWPPEVIPFILWAVLVTAGTLVGSSFLLSRPVRSVLAGRPAA